MTISPFAIDMYLPALPSIAADLSASTAATQMTLMVFFISFGVAQLISGPLSDFTGEIAEINAEQGRVKVLVSIFGRETPAELSFDQVKKLT